MLIFANGIAIITDKKKREYRKNNELNSTKYYNIKI